MLARLTSRNRLTLPETAVLAVGRCEYFDVSVEQGRIVLTPVRPDAARGVREKLESLGIEEGDVEAAIEWAREQPPPQERPPL